MAPGSRTFYQNTNTLHYYTPQQLKCEINFTNKFLSTSSVTFFTMLNIIGNVARSVAHRQQFVCTLRPLSVVKYGLSSLELEDQLGSFPSVKLRGLPYSASLDDITQFLTGIPPLDIVVPKNNKNGSVGVLFASVDDANAALERDKDTIGSRYIDVIRIPRAEYYSMAADSMAKSSAGDSSANLLEADEGSVVKMTGLPFQATVGDVQRFFAGERI